MLNSKPLDKLLFLDIETTSEYPTFLDAPEKVQGFFLKKHRKEIADYKHDETPEKLEAFYSAKSPLSPEYGKIVCISVGKLTIPATPEGDYVMSTTSFSGDDDKVILEEFIRKTGSVFNKLIPDYHVVAHAGNLFDIPFITKRFILNRLPLPAALDINQLKPWERTTFIDTLDVWKFGQFDGACGLDHLAYLFGVESSKTDMDGGDVKKVYWVDKDLPRIVTYCQRDIKTLAEVYLRMKNMSNKVIIKS